VFQAGFGYGKEQFGAKNCFKGRVTIMAGSRKKIFLKIFVKNTFLGVILCEKSISRIPKA
jgi:hypothetical protein